MFMAQRLIRVSACLVAGLACQVSAWAQPPTPAPAVQPLYERWAPQNLYSPRESPSVLDRPDSLVKRPDALTGSEKNARLIRDLILQGHQAYYRERYRAAIDAYKRAREQIDQNFPPAPGTFKDVQPPLLKGIRDKIVAERNTLKPPLMPTFTWRQVGGTLTVKFDDPDFATKVQAAVYEARRDTKSVADLQLRPDDDSVAVLLPHYYAYVIPVCLGDTYHQLGNYQRAIDYYTEAAGYGFLNKTAEVPGLWLRLARAYLAWGDARYRKDDRPGARELYEKVLLKNEPPDNELYDKPFAGLRKQVLKTVKEVPTAIGDRNAKIDLSSDVFELGRLFFTNPDMYKQRMNALADKKIEADGMYNPEMVALLRDLVGRQEQLRAGLNYLGYADDYVPPLRFAYLQGVARSFAQFAAQANREYISFKRSAEEETYNVQQLEQLVELNGFSYDVEIRRVEAAAAETASAKAAYRAATTRRTLAEHERDTYLQEGNNIVALDEALAWANAASVSKDDEILQRYSGLEHLGIPAGPGFFRLWGQSIPLYYRRSELIKRLTAERSRRTYGLEVGRLDRNVAQLRADEATAEKVGQAAAARETAAVMAADAAKWRWRASSQNLDYVRSKEINAELYYEFAAAVRESALLYLRRAIEVAFLMERAYEFENGANVRRVRFDYGDLGTANNLLAADLLLRDIDFFTHNRVTEEQGKPQPASRVISLANRHPLEFVNLRQTGEMHFATLLDDFQRDHPGLYQARIKRVELIVEGLVGTTGPVGSLTCGGVSRYRQRDGAVKYKLHPVETLLLTDYRPRRDALVADTPPEVLNVFENTGIDNTWVLSLPKHLNDFNYANLTDVRMVITYLGQHDSTLDEADLNKVPKTEDAVIWYSLRRDVAPDAFFLLAKTGQLDFAIERGMVPYNHKEPKIQGIKLIALKKGTSATVPVTVRLWSDLYGQDVPAYKPETDGTVIVQETGSRKGFHDLSPLTSWHLTLDSAANPTLKSDAGTSRLDLSTVSDILLVIQYQHSR
jgi:hypothetical protein